jgi:hypothetical protein
LQSSLISLYRIFSIKLWSTGNIDHQAYICIMNRQQFSELVKDPQTLGEGTIAELQDLLRNYPYCQTAQILLTFNLLSQNHSAYQAQLKKAVAYAGDRKKLKELLEIKKEHPTAVSTDFREEPLTMPDHHVAVPAQRSLETEHLPESVATPEIFPSIPASPPEPEVLPEANVSASFNVSTEEAQQDNYIEDSFITSEELDLASPLASTQEAEVADTVTPLSTIGKPAHVSLEKMTQDELLAIIRKRLAEINDENKGKVIKQEKIIQPQEKSNSHPVLKSVPEPARSKDELIEKFIREEPQITRPKKEFFNPTASSQKSNLDEEDIVSETLALLYAKQGNLQKAIHTYEKLSLRFSEKSRYFAAQIENLKGNTP